MSQIVNEPEASSKFERQYSPNMGMIFVSKFNSKEMLEHISIWTGVKRWTKASGGDNRRTGEAGFICTKLMEEVLDLYFGCWSWWYFWWGGSETNILTNEVIIVLSQGNWMLRPIEWLSDGQADGAWGSRWWFFEKERFDGQSTGWMDTNDNLARPCDGVALFQEWDVSPGYLPTFGFKRGDEGLDALTIVFRVNDCHYHLEVMQWVQLGNDGALKLLKGGGGITICELTWMDVVPVNLGCIPGSTDIVQHLVPADKDSVAQSELLE